MTRLLVIDDDSRSTPALCDCLRQLGCLVLHALPSEDIEECIAEFRPDGIILDLMMPPPQGVGRAELGSGYTTGAYLCREVIAKAAPSVPFVILTGADPSCTPVARAMDTLRGLDGFRGLLEKTGDEKYVLKKLFG